MDYGLQLYSIRDITGGDLDGSLAKVAALGYKFVEFAGFFGHSADDVAAMLKKHGLSVSGTHTGANELFDDLEATIAYHKTIGNDNIIIPGYDLSSQGKIDAFIEQVNEVLPKLAEAGIRLGYHNHHREFLPNEDGSVSHPQLEERTQMELEIDTYWAYVAGQDPVALLGRLGERVKVIHIKDGHANGEGTPLGQGTAPVAAVYAKALEMGIPMVVESETLTPDGITEAQVCIEYLRSLEK